MTIIVFDVGCLQDPARAPRIAAHARRLISLARHVSPLARGATLIGITDPALPALPVREAAWLDEVRPNAYVPEATGDAIFLNPAPEKNPIFAARLLLRADIFKTAIIEDFAASDNPAPENAAPSARLKHATALAWLRRYDLLLPVTADSVHPETAAKTAWDVIAEQFGRAELPRFAIGGRRPRIAMLTPMPPVKSGVAEYSAQTVKALEKYADVSVFGPGAAAVSETPYLARRFDRAVSVMGNSGYHSKIYDLHARCGSAVICHDSRLMHFFTKKFGAAKAAEMAGKELGRKVTDAEILAWHDDENQREAMCLGDLPETALPFICHSASMAAKVSARSRKPAVYLPFAIYRPWEFGALSALRKHEARERLRLARKEKIIVTFGFVNPSKAVAETVAALELLNGYARLIWVGEAHVPLPQSPHVSFLNQFISETTYRDYLLAADCGLQLRIGGSGNISGALQDCIAAGLPAVASADLAEALDAPPYISRVADVPDPAEIAKQLSLILTWKSDTENERAAYAATHGMDAYAEGLCKILALL
jgi:hypothetical protein